MKRQFSAKLTFLVLLFLLSFVSCQSTRTMDVIGKLESLEGEEKILAYEKAGREFPEPEILYNKAYHEIERKDYESAIETASLTLEMDPGFLRMRFLLLLSYRETGDREAYLKTLEDIAREIPNDKEIIELLLDSYKEERMYGEMVEAAKKLLQLSPENEKAINALAYESEYMKAISGIFDLEGLMEEIPEIKTTSTMEVEDIMDRIRNRFVYPFLF